MDMTLSQERGVLVARLVTGTLESERDATDLVGNASFQGAEVVILRADQLPATFYDLSTGLAGAVLQKFATYRLRLIVHGDFDGRGSDSLRALIRESNRGGHVAFVRDEREAMARLAG